LFQAILDRFEGYPVEKLTGPLGVEFASILGSTANWQLDLKQYAAAETSYQKILQLVPQVEQLKQEGAKRLQANTYHQLGVVAREQSQWAQAERYYEQALQLSSEDSDRFEQASTYVLVGILEREREREQWTPAREYLLSALEIFADYLDHENMARTLRQLALLWQSSHDAELPAAIAPLLGASREEVEALLRKRLE